MRRVGMLMNLAADDPESTARLTAFVQGLQEFGWTQGRNMRIDTRWAAGRPDLFRRYAEELVALGPDVILAATTPCVVALQRATRNVPIVFAAVVDPVGAGFAASLARPGGNATGFVVFEYALSGKWPQLLKEIAPNVKRVAVIRDPTLTSGVGQFAAIQTAALALGLELSPVGVEDPGEIERSLNEFALGANGGLIVPAVAQGAVYRDLIIGLAAKHRLPTIYPFRYFVAGGGLISYGPVRGPPRRNEGPTLKRAFTAKIGELDADRPYCEHVGLDTSEPVPNEIVVRLGRQCKDHACFGHLYLFRSGCLPLSVRVVRVFCLIFFRGWLSAVTIFASFLGARPTVGEA
jgi:putative ABC transport system substrate-binding protein